MRNLQVFCKLKMPPSKMVYFGFYSDEIIGEMEIADLRALCETCRSFIGLQGEELRISSK
jgi:hypothetical protein